MERYRETLASEFYIPIVVAYFFFITSRELLPNFGAPQHRFKFYGSLVLEIYATPTTN
jgi:hypothetical protein